MVGKSRIVAKIVLLMVSLTAGADLYAARLAGARSAVPKSGAKVAGPQSLARRFTTGATSFAGEFVVGAVPGVLTGSFNPYGLAIRLLVIRLLLMGGISGLLSKIPHVGGHLSGGIAEVAVSKVTMGRYNLLAAVKGVGISLLLPKLSPMIEKYFSQEDKEYPVPEEQDGLGQQPAQAPLPQTKNQTPLKNPSVAPFNPTIFINSLAEYDTTLLTTLDNIAKHLYGKSVQEIEGYSGFPPLLPTWNEQIATTQQLIAVVARTEKLINQLIPFSVVQCQRIVAALKSPQVQLFDQAESHVARINKSLWYSGMLRRILYFQLGREHLLVQALDGIKIDPVELVYTPPTND